MECKQPDRNLPAIRPFMTWERKQEMTLNSYYRTGNIFALDAHIEYLRESSCNRMMIDINVHHTPTGGRSFKVSRTAHFH